MRSVAIFRGFGPRHAAGLAERKIFIFDIIIYHPKEHSVRFSALNSKISLMATPLHVVEKQGFNEIEIKRGNNNKIHTGFLIKEKTGYLVCLFFWAKV